MIIIAIILVVLIFGSLIFVHELGHFLAARRNGVDVEEFGFGFPPRIFGWRGKKTLYSLNLLPLGGFVRLRGEDGSDTSLGTFAGAGLWAKTKILLAGVGMNALMAYVLLLFLCVVGLPALFASSFRLPTPSSTTPKQVMVVGVESGSPAASAGIVKGDIIATAGAQALSSEDDLTGFTKSHADQTVQLSIRHAGSQRTVMVKLRDAKAGQDAGYLGVAPLQVYNQRFGWQSIWVAAWLGIQMITATLAGLFGAIIALFVRHAGQAAAQISGPVGIVVILSNIMYLGANYVLFFMATISISLAVINVLPIPAIDGGRLFLIWLGKLRRKAISPELEAKIHTIGFAALILLMVVITILDIKRLHS